MNTVEVVSVEVVVHATLKVDGKLVKVRFADKGAGQLELAPDTAEHEIPDYIIEQIRQESRFNR